MSDLISSITQSQNSQMTYGKENGDTNKNLNKNGNKIEKKPKSRPKSYWQDSRSTSAMSPLENHSNNKNLIYNISLSNPDFQSNSKNSSTNDFITNQTNHSHNNNNNDWLTRSESDLSQIHSNYSSNIIPSTENPFIFPHSNNQTFSNNKFFYKEEKSPENPHILLSNSSSNLNPFLDNTEPKISHLKKRSSTNYLRQSSEINNEFSEARNNFLFPSTKISLDTTDGDLTGSYRRNAHQKGASDHSISYSTGATCYDIDRPSTLPCSDSDTFETDFSFIPTCLVYAHIVTPDDTMARIRLVYDASPEVIKNANRLSANDKIQTKSILLIPLYDCKNKYVLNRNQSEIDKKTENICKKLKIPHSFEGSVTIPNLGKVSVIRVPKKILSLFPPGRVSRIRNRVHQNLPGGSGVKNDSDDDLSIPTKFLPDSFNKILQLPINNTNYTQSEGNSSRQSMESINSQKSLGGIIEEARSQIHKFVRVLQDGSSNSKEIELRHQ